MKPAHYRAIFASAKQHEMSNDDVHALVKERFGKDSLKQLTLNEFRMLMDGMNGKPGGGRERSSRERNWARGNHGRKDVQPKQEFLVTPRDLELLGEMAALRGWSRDTLDTFIGRQLKGRQIRTTSDLNKVMWPLKRMNLRDGLFSPEKFKLEKAKREQGNE